MNKAELSRFVKSQRLVMAGLQTFTLQSSVAVASL